jgi:hypothetical protein
MPWRQRAGWSSSIMSPLPGPLSYSPTVGFWPTNALGVDI